jgi:hypothetical protein
MEKEFVSYEQALALRELGFDEPCFGRYIYDGRGKEWFLVQTQQTKSASVIFEGARSVDGISVVAPLYQQAFRWFREKYELSCSIELTDNSRYYYYDFTISDSKNRDYNDEDCFDSCKRIYDDGKFGKYEEAELECLKKLIEIVKNK